MKLVAYSCGRWLPCSHCWSSYSERCSTTEYIFLHVRSDWGNTLKNETDRQRERRLVFFLKLSEKVYARNNRPSACLTVLMRCVGETANIQSLSKSLYFSVNESTGVCSQM